MTPDSLLHSEADEMLRKAATELRRNLETGQDCHAETILNAFPYLASDPDRAVELIVLEFQLRRQLGQNPQPRDWYERFPQWGEQLRARLEEALANLDRGDRETTAFATSPYGDADRQTVEETNVDVPVLGRHEILEEIDRGGMGVVYRAYDRVLDRVVALKVIRSGTLASADEVRRFYREARAAAQLRHPNIVPIYGMGLYEKQHCFTMAFFPRGSLAQHLAAYDQDMRGAVRLVVKIARAVQTAHDQGIIHRDLKPGNILLDEHGEPVVSDFGLAKSLEASVTVTLPAQPVGTPAYMAPEQARSEAATRASDIWSLGIILYELLTGRVPFPGRDVDEVKHRVVQEDPISPRRYRPDLPRDLVTILLTCLEKKPARRYLSAAALADDLERWLGSKPVRARLPSWPRRIGRVVRRHRWMTACATFAGYTAVVLGILSFLNRAPDPDQPLKEIQRQLKQGQAVTLIGETGPPRWSRWQEPQVSPGPSTAPDQPLLINSTTMALLELLPEVPPPCYRFRAEVRQEDTSGLGMAGIYFMHRSYTTRADDIPGHCFWELAFNDLQASLFGAKHPIGLHPIGLQCRLYRRWGVGPNQILNGKQSDHPPLLFAPAVAPNGLGVTWRKLSLEVTPIQVQAFWQGQLIHEVSWVDLARIATEMVQDEPAPIRFPAGAFPGTALGLYVSGTRASFRSVVIEPLEN